MIPEQLLLSFFLILPIMFATTFGKELRKAQRAPLCNHTSNVSHFNFGSRFQAPQVPSVFGAQIVMARPVLLPVLGVVAAVYTASLAFVGTPQAAPVVSRVPARVSAEYLERLGPKDSDVPFDPSAATGPGASVEFKKRPFGILRYQPGQGMKGAMAMEIIPKSRYPGDPQGQAFASGVQPGWVVASINGQNVQNEDFHKIMDLLDDEVADPRFSKSTALALEKQGGRLAEPAASPLAVQFNSIPGYVYKGAELKEDGQDGFAR